MKKSRKTNRYELFDTYGVGYIKDIGFIFDLEDYDLIKDYCWNFDGRGYVRTYTTGKGLFIHRLVTNAPSEFFVDHVDLNPLNNRKSNLRFVNHRQNAQNKTKSKKKTMSSVYVGVSFRKNEKKWRAQIYDNEGKNVWIGTFPTEEEAAIAYNKKAEELGYLTRNIIEGDE